MNQYIEKAIKLAEKSRCRYRHACIVVRDGRIVSEATNKKVGDPSVAWRCSHIHAEAAAIISAGTYASGSTVYVARINAYGEPVSSEPCKRCKSLLARYGVARVVWT